MAGKNQKHQHPNPTHTTHTPRPTPTKQQEKNNTCEPCTRIRALLFQDPTVCHTINPITTNQHPFHTTPEGMTVLNCQPAPPGTYSLIFHP
ncbi:hypothetical protein H4V95_003392 [Arthrobacter sp. CAN_C5]|nr:hypothetical protein [Arthrobacter sp. CAN_C5]